MANILIVDDSSDILERSSQWLEWAGYRVETRRNGEEGFQSLGAGPLPDCVVLDVNMPVVSGPGLVHRMLLHDAGEEPIPTWLVSGKDDLAEVIRCNGTPDLLVKSSPDFESPLLAILDRALRERRAPAAS